MHLQRPCCNGFVLSFDEHRAILKERLAVLDAATSATTLGSKLPVAWRRGWTCEFTVRGRDRDGSLLVEYLCLGPEMPRGYVRKRRFVRRELQAEVNG